MTKRRLTSTALETADAGAGREAWELLIRLFPGFRNNLMAVWAELDLSPAQGRLLQYLDPERPLPMTELASFHACEASNITGIVDKLEARGLIERVPSPTDRRVKMIAVTKAGAKFRSTLLEHIAEPPPFIESLSPTEQRTLRDILAKATEGLSPMGCAGLGRRESHKPHDLVARATIEIRTSRASVWDALVSPEMIKRYMFGTTVVSDWREGGAIGWKGEWKGKGYSDKGVILKLEPGRLLQYSHFSPLSGLPDTPENYHTVTIRLADEGTQTRVELTQDHNPTEQAREHSTKNWGMVLAGLKAVLEGGR